MRARERARERERDRSIDIKEGKRMREMGRDGEKEKKQTHREIKWAVREGEKRYNPEFPTGLQKYLSIYLHNMRGVKQTSKIVLNIMDVLVCTCLLVSLGRKVLTDEHFVSKH